MRRRPLPLSVRLALASVASVTAVFLVALVGLSSLDKVFAGTREAFGHHLELLNDTSAFESLLYQKGFAAEYMLTGDPSWLRELERSRADFEPWLERARAGVVSDAARGLLSEIEHEYAGFDGARRRMLELHDEGRKEAARAVLHETHERIERLLALFQRFGSVGRLQAFQQLGEAERSLRRRAGGLVAVSVAAALSSLLLGFWWARRVARPILELQLQVESAAERTRIRVGTERGDLAGLGEQVAAMVERLDEVNATLAEQRRRLVQSEKLSAVGELAAKLAHEILNPLAGMKAAVQLLASAESAPAADDVRDTAEALDREIGRVEALVRRLVNYARPLAPRFEVCPVEQLLDDAVAAVGPELDRCEVKLARQQDAGLPPLEVDPLLTVQALRNLLANAIQVTARGGTVRLGASLTRAPGRPHVAFTVVDGGTGLAPDILPHLFHPFFTTKPGGHGLGLAVSQNIALEHGGRIEARNRDDGTTGAVFELVVPLIR